MPETETIELKIEGMHCVSCEGAIKGALTKLPGVVSAEVSFVGGGAKVSAKVGRVSAAEAIQAIVSVGYSAYVLAGRNEKDIEKGERKDFWFQLVNVILSALFTLPLVVQMFMMLGGGEPFLPLWFEFLLGTIVQFGFGWRFYSGSYYSLKSLTGNMDLLIGLGTSAAYLYSACIFLFSLPGHVYFESSASIITLILLGRFFELTTKKKTSSAIAGLFKLQPKTARVKRNGAFEMVPIEKIKVGDLFQVRPGEKVAIDGEVVEGHSKVDESMLTGESLPASKEKGSKVYAATQNQTGSFIGKATAIGADTALSGIIRLVKEAQSSKAPIQKLADQISAIFVPIVLVVALVTFLIWWGLAHDLSQAIISAVAVLVIACPCALGMATPTVIMVATGLGAKLGILIKNAEAIQLAKKLTHIAIDKTGTLTSGKPVLTDVIADNKEYALKLAASLEEHSEHPISHAIISAYSGEKIRVERFEALAGKGICAEIEGEKIYAGSLSLAQELNHKIDPKIVAPLEELGKTVLIVADESRIIGYLAVTDALREHSAEAVEAFKKRGLEVWMLTGDREKTASVIAKLSNIEHVKAGIFPQDKASSVENLKAKQKVVGMIGDGINDAPALAAADVGFSMSSGTDIAIEASDVTLMQSNLLKAVEAIDLSKATFSKIKQNLFFAFIYNILGIPLAAFGLLNPIIAGAAMAASSLSVVINALLLNRWKGYGKT